MIMKNENNISVISPIELDQAKNSFPVVNFHNNHSAFSANSAVCE